MVDAVVRIVKTAVADPFDGTVTVDADQDAVAPGTAPQFNATGVTGPENPLTLVNVATKLVVAPGLMVVVIGVAVTLKSPVPENVTVFSCPLDISRTTQRYDPICGTLNGPKLYTPNEFAIAVKTGTDPSG